MVATKLQWYLTRYVRLSNGEFELLSYAPTHSLAEAQHRAQTKLPNNEFYEVESRLGSLLSPMRFCWVARDRYSHKPQVQLMQVEAELTALRILRRITTNKIDLKNTFAQIREIRPFLTAPQFEVLFTALKTNPKVMQIIYERSTK